MQMDNKRIDRELETREDFQRGESWKPASLLPEFNKVPGWAYRWVRTSVMNDPDNLNVSSKMREGWEPVKLADHPEMKLMVDQNSRFKDGIEIGGLLLCKIPEEFVKQRSAHYQQKAQQQADAVDNSFMKQNDPRMPLFKDSKSTVTFGKGK
jgi:hypothetical protein